MSGHYLLDELGNAVRCDDGVVEWARGFEKTDRKVASTYVGKVHISTVFLGLDHQFDYGGPPLIFETMVFGGKFDGYQQRYSTQHEALQGHWKVVKKVQKGRSWFLRLVGL